MILSGASTPTSGMRPVRTAAIAALATLIVHVVANPHYGFFRDELYFIICGFHPAWGYVDQPPLVPLLAAGSQLFGHSLVALARAPRRMRRGGRLRHLPARASSWAAACLPRCLRRSRIFAAGVLESFGMKVGPDMIGLWLWPLTALYVLRVVKGADPRWWLGAGICIGVSLESKYSAIFFAVALVAGLLLTPQRRVLCSRWFFAGARVAAAIALPNFLWQAAARIPDVGAAAQRSNGKNVVASPALFLFQQLLITNLFASPIWIVGLVWLLSNSGAALSWPMHTSC